jgi:hypothetical protein
MTNEKNESGAEETQVILEYYSGPNPKETDDTEAYTIWLKRNTMKWCNE